MRRVLITGGASGLGAALVRCCLERGDHVTVIDRVQPGLVDSSPGAEWIRADLGAPGAIAGLADALADHAPHDLVVLCAGISATGPFEAIAPSRNAAVIAVNLLAPAQLVALLSRRRQFARGGRLVLVSSLSHYTGYPGAAVYAGTKDGLVALARSLRRPMWDSDRVRVQILAPGPMDTPHATEHAPPGADAGRRSDPAAIAACLLAVSPRRTMVVPGGQARLAALFGRLLPGVATAVMRRLLYDRLRPPA